MVFTMWVTFQVTVAILLHSSMIVHESHYMYIHMYQMMFSQLESVPAYYIRFHNYKLFLLIICVYKKTK